MTNNPQISFETVKEFKKYCKTNNIIPEIQYVAKKHQNRKCEFLHEIYGVFLLGGVAIDFKIDEMAAFTDKKNPRNGGYKIGTLRKPD